MDSSHRPHILYPPPHSLCFFCSHFPLCSGTTVNEKENKNASVLSMLIVYKVPRPSIAPHKIT